jgi:hypothetical protein
MAAEVRKDEGIDELHSRASQSGGEASGQGVGAHDSFGARIFQESTEAAQ